MELILQVKVAMFIHGTLIKATSMVHNLFRNSPVSHGKA